jgi:hypothetical protein
VGSFGIARVIALLDQFEASLPETGTELMQLLAVPAAARADAVLHTFKGAALTLGLTASGDMAQAMRPPAALTDAAVQALMARVRQDLSETRADLNSRLTTAA